MKIIYTSLLMLFAANTHAGAVSQLGEGEPLNLVYIEMKYLYQVGTEIHSQYDHTEPMDVRQCKNMNGYILTRARSMIGTAGQIKDPALRDEVIDASWQAYACASCEKPVSACEPVPGHLEDIKAEIKSRAESDNSDE